MGEHLTESDAPYFAKVNFKCQWCGGHFVYKPGLIGRNLGVTINVERVGDRCIRHGARLVDTTPTPPERSDA